MNVDDIRAASTFIHENSTTTDINALWNTFNDSCISIIEKQIPSISTSSRFDQPWIKRQVKRLSRRKKIKAYRKSKFNSTPEDLTKYKQLQNDTQQECKKHTTAM
jgi:hypothetical protein